MPKGKAYMLMLPILVIFLGSALAVIYSKYRSRSVFIEIQKLERDLDRYEVEWGQLQLELRTLADQNRVENIARTKQRLIIPEREKIIFLKP